MYRKSGQGKKKTKRSGRSLSFGPEWDGMGNKSRDGGAINHRCDNCVRACVRASVAGPAGGDREEKFER